MLLLLLQLQLQRCTSLGPKPHSSPIFPFQCTWPMATHTHTHTPWRRDGKNKDNITGPALRVLECQWCCCCHVPAKRKIGG
uniref:Putative secreted protein n=1 Tax=Anopheles triannulatus TaxID=58253 RepID=A0A2M4B470_9DIPT